MVWSGPDGLDGPTGLAHTRGTPLLILAAFAARVTPCLPPYIDLHLLNNLTALEEHLYRSDFSAGSGWTHSLGESSPLAPWPMEKKDVSLADFPYCFKDQYTKGRLAT